MPWGEAVRMTRLLASDPSSYIAAALNDWDRPVSTEALALYDVFDLLHQVNSRKRPRPHPGRPLTRRRAKPTLSQTAVVAALRMAGHTGPLPKGVHGG